MLMYVFTVQGLRVQGDVQGGEVRHTNYRIPYNTSIFKNGFMKVSNKKSIFVNVFS